jgi:surface protein
MKQGMQPQTIIATNDTIHQIVKDEIAKYGNTANLNHINVSQVTSMFSLFKDSSFNGDISQWDVSNVTNMNLMFHRSGFKGDISKWDVSNVTTMAGMFIGSPFNGDISQWNVSKVEHMYSMFYCSILSGHSPSLFKNVPLNRHIENWILHANCNVERMLYRPSESPMLPPLLAIDSIEPYQRKLYAMFGESDQWMNLISKDTAAITANHGVFLLLAPDEIPSAIHPELTREDAEKLQLLYQLTGSVYQSVKLWDTPRKTSIPISLDTSVALALEE